MLRISQKGIDFIKREEEGTKCALQSYKCPAGYWTIGWGCRFWENGTQVKENESITLERADSLFLKKVSQLAEDAIYKNVKIELSQNQYDSLCSLIFNIGPWVFIKSKALKYLNVSDFKNFCIEAFSQEKGFNKINGKFSKGLHNRRQREKNMFEEV